MQYTYSRSLVGSIGEDAACEHLRKKGYAILVRNWRVRGGEIDIVAKRGDELVFVEVKARRSVTYGYPEQGVDFFKQKRLRRAIGAYLSQMRGDFYVRIDIIAVIVGDQMGSFEVNHIENAFNYGN